MTLQPSSDAVPDTPRPLGAGTDRIGSLDFIRGLAVMGILFANIVSFGQPMAAYLYPGAFLRDHGQVEDWMWVAQCVLIDGKMRGLFTLLFGAGLYLFMERAWARGATRRLQIRRLLWLGLFGLAHFYLLWRGDILFSYAVAGLVAVLCLRWPARRQIGLGIAGYLAGALLLGASLGYSWVAAETPMGKTEELAEANRSMAAEVQAELAEGQRETSIILSGGYDDYVAYNLTEHTFEPMAFVGFMILETLPLMLIGMGLYRIGFFSGGIERASLRKWGWIGVIGGTVLTVPIALWALGEGLSYWSTMAALIGFSQLPRLFVIIGLAALLVLASERAGGWLGQRVSAAGRAAFSNYLGTSLVMLFVFHGWAGGLFGQLSRGELYLVAIGACGIMLAWSKPWLDRFAYGPLEWLWRCLTYWRRFPIRRNRLANANDSHQVSCSKQERPPLYVCICNAIRETELRNAARRCGGDAEACYALLGKRPNCGNCLDEAEEMIFEERELGFRPAVAA